MAKEGKVKKSAISGSGVLDLSDEQLANARERKDYGKNDGQLLPAGQYVAEVTEATIEQQGGSGATAGSDKYTLKLRVVEGPNEGRVCFFRAIAHGSTAGQVFNMLEAFNVDVTSLGKQIKLPTESDIQAWVGSKVTAYVKHRDYNGKPQLDVTLDPIAGEGAKKAKKTKIAK